MSDRDRQDTMADLILETVRSAQQTFAAGVVAGDAAGDSARKLARLIERCEVIASLYWKGTDGERLMRAAIEEARR